MKKRKRKRKKSEEKLYDMELRMRKEAIKMSARRKMDYVR
jgi:hypothetical protein